MNNDNNKVTNAASIANSAAQINEVKEQYPENKIHNRDFKRIMLSILGCFISSVTLGALLIFYGVDWLISFLIAGSAFLIITVIYTIIDVLVIRSGLSNAERIILEKGFGQIITLNGEAYFTEYTKPHSKEEAAEMVDRYLSNNETIHGLHIFKLLDIKHRKTKKYLGKYVEVIGFTYDYLTNPVKSEYERLYSKKIPIYHDDPAYYSIQNLPHYRATEEDILKNKKVLRKGFIAATIALGFALWMPTGNALLLAIFVGLPIYYAWDCTTIEIYIHTFMRYVLRIYIIVTCIIGCINLFMLMSWY